MDRTTVFLDDRTLQIIKAKQAEMSAAQGPVSVAATIRAIIAEWDWIRSMGSSTDAGKSQKVTA